MSDMSVSMVVGGCVVTGGGVLGGEVGVNLREDAAESASRRRVKLIVRLGFWDRPHFYISCLTQMFLFRRRWSAPSSRRDHHISMPVSPYFIHSRFPEWAAEEMAICALVARECMRAWALSLRAHTERSAMSRTRDGF